MKFFLALIFVTGSAIAGANFNDKTFKKAISSCGGPLHPVEAPDYADTMLKKCVKEKLEEVKKFEDLKETFEFWSPFHTMKQNDARYRCRGHIGKKNMHGEDSGEFEACVKQQNCVYPNGVDHIGLSPAPCVTENELGVGHAPHISSETKKKEAAEALEEKKKSKSGVAEQ